MRGTTPSGRNTPSHDGMATGEKCSVVTIDAAGNRRVIVSSAARLEATGRIQQAIEISRRAFGAY
jgi:hypothetical protein